MLDAYDVWAKLAVLLQLPEKEAYRHASQPWHVAALQSWILLPLLQATVAYCQDYSLEEAQSLSFDCHASQQEHRTSAMLRGHVHIIIHADVQITCFITRSLKTCSPSRSFSVVGAWHTPGQ